MSILSIAFNEPLVDIVVYDTLGQPLQIGNNLKATGKMHLNFHLNITLFKGNHILHVASGDTV